MSAGDSTRISEIKAALEHALSDARTKGQLDGFAAPALASLLDEDDLAFCLRAEVRDPEAATPTTLRYAAAWDRYDQLRDEGMSVEAAVESAADEFRITPDLMRDIKDGKRRPVNKERQRRRRTPTQNESVFRPTGAA